MWSFNAGTAVCDIVLYLIFVRLGGYMGFIEMIKKRSVFTNIGILLGILLIIIDRYILKIPRMMHIFLLVVSLILLAIGIMMDRKNDITEIDDEEG